jgi:hypothetical protein
MNRAASLIVICTAMFALTAASPFLLNAAPATDVTGTWNFDVKAEAGSGSPTFVFKQAGEKLTGTYKGQLGEAPINGTVRGSEIKFTFKGMQDIEVEYSGTVEGNTMKGTVSLGSYGKGTFTGKKQ